MQEDFATPIVKLLEFTRYSNNRLWSSFPMSKFSIDEIRAMISSIRSEDKNARMHALSNLHVVAQALGPDRTRNELIPYTIETTDHDENALRRIAKELGVMLKEVGGAKHVSSLTKPLRFLCESEDPRVSKPAITSLVKIGNELSKDELKEVYAPLIRELCEDGWHPLRCAGAVVLCELYGKMHDAVKTALVPILTALANDQMVLVRKSLALSIPKLLRSAKSVPDTLVPVLKSLAADKSAAVAIEVPECLIVLGELKPELALSLSETLFTSEIWQARAVLVSSLDKIFAKNPPKTFLKDVATTASTDTASSVVRASIARQVTFIYNSGCFDRPDDFAQFVSVLITDAEASVRTAVASAIAGMPHDLAESIDGWLGALLNDDELDVKMAALQSVAATGIGITAAANDLSELIRFTGWRVKKGIAELTPKIAATLEAAAFNKEILPIVKALLNDEAADVRTAMITALPPLVAKFGTKWRDAELTKIINALFDSPDYMLRKSAISAIVVLDMTKEFNSVIEKAVKDPVPNVRMVLARELPRNSKVLATLAKDSDPDVAFYASKK